MTQCTAVDRDQKQERETEVTGDVSAAHGGGGGSYSRRIHGEVVVRRVTAAAVVRLGNMAENYQRQWSW
ncbi:hypothetical protein HanIR_Chr14g0696271 [Helianthus annuus]|nr:hypothetical protein HanIR_Chr14g0696271 [Helianthus annuus]